MIRSFSLHEPSEEAQQTIKSILVEGSSIKLLPTICINAAGELEGFQLLVPGDSKGGVLPINRTMFHGTSVFEVHSKSGGVFNADIMRLIQQTMDAKESMRELMTKIAKDSDGKEASFRCIPDNVDCMSSVKSDGSVMEAHVLRTTGKRNVDFVDWKPELPHSIGLYQAFCRGYQKDTRVHKLFIGINGGLNRCSYEFYNLLLDVGNEFNCKDVSFSEEVWWLRKACQRARCRVALMAAEHLGLNITTTRDLFSFNQDMIGVPVADTIEFDIKEGSDDMVEFYSGCVDTTGIQNGILAKMHEGEGIWVFRGSAKSSAKSPPLARSLDPRSTAVSFPHAPRTTSATRAASAMSKGWTPTSWHGILPSPAPSRIGLYSSASTSASLSISRACSGTGIAALSNWCP